MKTGVYLILLMLFPHSAFSADAALEYRTMQQWKVLEEEKRRTCETLKKDPSCSPALNNLRSYGLTTVQCVQERDANNCDAFIAQFPEYANQRATCTPHDVCKQVLASTAMNGCIQAGLQPVRGFWDALKNLDLRSAAQTAFIESFQFALNPALYVARKGQQAGNSFIEGVQRDRTQFRRLACLNADAQQQFACYSMFKYGSMVIGAGATARMGASFVTRMELLEKHLATPLRKVVDRRRATPEPQRTTTRANGTTPARAVNESSLPRRTAAATTAKQGRSEVRASRTETRQTPRASSTAARHNRETPEQLKTRLLEFDPVTDADRAEAISIANSAQARGSVTLDVENSALQKLNGEIDKDLATALTNQHKEILSERMKAFAEKYKGQIDVKFYSDFKSQRFILVPTRRDLRATGIPERILTELDDILEASNREFVEKLRQTGVQMPRDPASLFRASLDSSADEANLNIGFSQEINDNSGRTIRSNDPRIQAAKQKAFQELERTRSRIDRSFGADSPILDSVDGVRIVKAEIFDIVKKADGDIAEIKSAIEASYPGVRVSGSAAAELANYANLTNRFKPGIWQTGREVASAAEAKFGAVTLDVKGMGANNVYQTALQASRCATVTQVAACTREGERTVTRDFREKMTTIREISTANCRKYGLECFVRISGDDVVVIPTNGPLPRQFARENVAAINGQIGTAQVRQVEIPPGIESGPFRVALDVDGQKIEKAIADKWRANPALASRLRNVTISVNMRTRIPNMGDVQVSVSGPGMNNLTAADRAAIRRAARDGLSDFNNADRSRTYNLGY